MNKVFFRVDANEVVGFGHFYRCLELAKEFLNKNVIPVFILKYYTKSVIEVIENHNIQYELLVFNNEIANREEINHIKKLKEVHNAKVVFLDIDHKLYKESIVEYENYLKSIDSFFYTIMFGDFSPITFYSDMIIVPYVGAQTYHKSLENVLKKKLLGEEYFILRKEFLKYKDKYSLREKVFNIVITMGGSNPSCSIEKAVESIMLTSFTGNCTIIVGKEAKIDFEVLVQKMSCSPIEFSFVFNNSNFIEYLWKSDIVFTNSGLTKYETMYLGIPTFTFSINEDHKELMDLFEKETKSIIHLGNVNSLKENVIAEHLENFILDFDKRKRFSERGKKLIDGNGLDRILNQVLMEIKKLNEK